MFRTPIKIDAPNYSISHEDNIFLMGSCFAENISRRLDALQYKTIQNPYGILYNPMSISKSLESIILNKEYEHKELFYHNGLWHSYDHHGIFSNPNPIFVLEKINSSIKGAHEFLKKSNILIVTFGTANVFMLKKTQEIVANCHKVPNHQFERQRLSVDEIVENLTQWMTQLSNFGNSNIASKRKIILTVSPIRHIRDGLVENQRSKSTLLLAINEIEKQFSNISYFPAYEILMDDLRDYRFYKKDMIHPNEAAIDYIWKQFSLSFFSDETKDMNREIQQVVNGLKHRLLHPETEESLKFKVSLERKIGQLEQKYPNLDFSKYIKKGINQ